MTVKELIQELMTMPMDQVVIASSESEEDKYVLSVYGEADTVMLELDESVISI